MNITFIGATHEVTGSCTLLEISGEYFLVDYGMEQGTNVFENVPLPVKPSDISAVFLTHAHVDHSGMLPKLVKEGFSGPIYATEATCNLADIMLKDCAHIQEHEAEWQNRKGMRAGRRPVEPVYDINDAEKAIHFLRPCDYLKTYTVSEHVVIRFTDIGHLLGSAAIEVWLSENDEVRKIVFSGDIGNHDRPILKDPQTIDEADYLVIESTYGNRLHEAPQDAVEDLADVIQHTLDRGGNVVIPAFAIGRTQEMLYAIREIKENQMVTGHDSFPVYLDSPLANHATGVFLQCPRDYLDEETVEILNRGQNPIWFPGLHLSESAEESRNINLDSEPKVIISAGGMCDGGRIRHHLKHNLWRKDSTILFVGYQSPGTLGRLILDGARNVTLFGEHITINAEIASIKGASGHADQKDLLKWAAAFKKGPQLVFVNHGEDESVQAFGELLTKELGYNTAEPYSGTEYNLLTGEPVVITEGVPITKEDIPIKTKALRTHNDLMDAVEALTAVAENLKGRSNREIRSLTKELESLVKKYK